VEETNSADSLVNEHINNIKFKEQNVSLNLDKLALLEICQQLSFLPVGEPVS